MNKNTFYLAPDWLAGILGRPVETVEAEQIGTDQIGTCYRLRMDGGDSVLVKLPPPNAGEREMMAGAYRAEIRFYQQIASTVAVRTPYCHHAEIDDSGDFVLVMEDLAPAVPGDQIAGCTPPQARAAVVNLAGLHGPRWCDATLLDVVRLDHREPRPDRREVRRLLREQQREHPVAERQSAGLVPHRLDLAHGGYITVQ